MYLGSHYAYKTGANLLVPHLVIDAPYLPDLALHSIKISNDMLSNYDALLSSSKALSAIEENALSSYLQSNIGAAYQRHIDKKTKLKMLSYFVVRSEKSQTAIHNLSFSLSDSLF